MLMPIRDNLLCKAVFDESKKGSIFLSTPEFKYKYLVLGVGASVEHVCKEDIIQADALRYPIIEIDGQEFTIIPEKHVFGIYCDYEV